jgi:hypothetical protein
MECAVGYAHKGLQIMSMRVFLVAFENSQSSHKITLLEEVGYIWQLVFLLKIIDSWHIPASWQAAEEEAFASAL